MSPDSNVTKLFNMTKKIIPFLKYVVLEEKIKEGSERKPWLNRKKEALNLSFSL